MRSKKIRNNRLLIYASGLVLVFAIGYLALAAVSVGNPRPATPIRLVSGEWEPFVGSSLAGDGPVARIVTETFQHMGYKPEITFASWDLILDQTQRVDVLGAFPFIASESRLERYDLSEPILEFEYVLFYHRPNVPEPAQLVTAEDFLEQGYTFGKVSGYDVWSALADADFDFREYPTREDAFQALIAGEIDFLPEGRLVGEALIRSATITAGVNAIGYLDASDNELLGTSEALYLLLPKSESARRLLDRFNQELRRVKQTTVYSDALTEINRAGEQRWTVELQPLPDAAFISLLDSEGDNYQAPLGTRALVVEWAPVFEAPVVAGDTASSMVTVKLLNGPLRGRVMRVDARAVRLVP